MISLSATLWRAMPWTASLFALGAVAISGLPPLNGFVSEWLVYLGLFDAVTNRLEQSVQSLELAKKTLQNVMGKIGQGISGLRNIQGFLELILETATSAFEGKVGTPAPQMAEGKKIADITYQMPSSHQFTSQGHGTDGSSSTGTSASMTGREEGEAISSSEV